MDIQLTLTILLIIIELVAFAWLIIDIQKSKKKQDKIIELEYQENGELAIGLRLLKKKHFLLLGTDVI